MGRAPGLFGAVALLLPLLAPPVVGASAAGAGVPPSPRATATPNGPCGVVEFVPVAPPHIADGTWYERIRVTVSFRDGHRETAQFPYPWVYPSGEQTDPWSTTNLRRPDFAVALQPPPAGTDLQVLPPLIRYVLEHSDAKGFTDLPDCTPTGSSHQLAPTPSSRELQAEIAADIAGKSTRTPGSITPCGTFELGRAAPPRHEGNNTYETIGVTLTFADGHHELVVFPYPWVYNDRSDRNPFAGTNGMAPDYSYPLRMPPKGTDTSAYPPALRFLLAHMGSGGYGTLPNCPAYGSPTTWPDSAGIDFVDASAPDSPVEIIDPRDYALGCIAFRNRSDRTLSGVHVTLTQVDRAGHTKPPARIDRFGSFSPGVLIAGMPRGMRWGRTSNNMLRNCRWDFSWSPDFPVIRIAVTAAEFGDGSTWVPSSREPLHGSP